MVDHLKPSPDGFEKDPIGYSALAWHKWGLIQTVNGFPTDISKPPTAEDLKDPVLWLSHAAALSEAAVTLVRVDPLLTAFPPPLRTITHSQYYAVALMLVGYSLEVCLKAMLLLRIGPEKFLSEEKKHLHHDLNRLSEFITDLSDKDRAILTCLSQFVRWAGRYPDPGAKNIGSAIDVFQLSEHHQISAKDLFGLSSKIMKQTKQAVE